MVNNRKLKVYETAYQIKKSNSFWTCEKESVFVPQIRLQGKWLKECGFEPGSQVHIRCEHGKLVITKE